jgi:hypothetical protein
MLHTFCDIALKLLREARDLTPILIKLVGNVSFSHSKIIIFKIKIIIFRNPRPKNLRF